MPKSSHPTRRSAATPSARPASAASRAAKPRARSRASETPPPDLEDRDDDTPPPAFTPAQIRARHDGWSPERQVRFVEALAESGCVEEACRTVGLSKQSAYALRMRVDAQGFRMAWEAAMELAIRRLSDECYARALHGEEIPHYFQGELIGTHRRYDNRLAMFLLRYRDPLRYAATLDQMVYTGHPEGVALAFAKARDRCADEAWGIADQPAAAVDPAPWTTKPLAEARAETDEETLIENTRIPVGGSYERRERIRRLRAERHGPRGRAEARERQQAEAEFLQTFDEAIRRFETPGVDGDAENPAKADMPSSSSISEPDPPHGETADALFETAPGRPEHPFGAARRLPDDPGVSPGQTLSPSPSAGEPALRRLD